MLGALGATACIPLTREEVAASLEEAELFSQAATLIGNTVDLSSGFTIGGAVEDSMENLREFYESQLPCAEVTLEDGTLAVEYGATGTSCIHKGMAFTGRHEVTVSVVSAKSIVVDHLWTDLSNGKMQVNGTARVTWKGADDASRRVVHDLMWERLSDGRTANGTGDRTQRPLDGDLAVGITVSGDAEWDGESGLWDLRIDDVDMRWVDPVPQAGSYLLATPFDQSVEFSFERTAPKNVHVTAKTGDRKYESDVKTVE